MSHYLDYIVAVTAIALAVMGIIPAYAAFSCTKKVIWISGISVIAIINVVASIFAIHAMHVAQDTILGVTTGDNSYAFIMPASVDREHLQLMLRQEGDYTVRGLQVRIEDVNVLQEASNNSFTKAQNIIPAGDLAPKQGKDVAVYPLNPNVGHQCFVIQLLATNGLLANKGQAIEYLRLFWVKNHWSVAYKVFNQDDVLKEEISSDFPKAQLWK
jgi:hypothetical protein